jgi:hypothetical protein
MPLPLAIREFRRSSSNYHQFMFVVVIKGWGYEDAASQAL